MRLSVNGIRRDSTQLSSADLQFRGRGFCCPARLSTAKSRRPPISPARQLRVIQPRQLRAHNKRRGWVLLCRVAFCCLCFSLRCCFYCGTAFAAVLLSTPIWSIELSALRLSPCSASTHTPRRNVAKKAPSNSPFLIYCTGCTAHCGTAFTAYCGTALLRY